MHGKGGPEFGVVIGRLKQDGRRFLANTLADPAVLLDLQDRESLGRTGMVRREGEENIWAAENAFL